MDEVILGCVLQAGLGQNPARQAAIGAGIPIEVPATTINMLCGSGLKAVALATQMIRAGDVEIVVAGGMENMTRSPYLMPEARFGAKMGSTELIDSMVHDGLTDAFNDIHMGVTAENVADAYGITRAQQDEFAAESQHRAEQAIYAGAFTDEMCRWRSPTSAAPAALRSMCNPEPGRQPRRSGGHSFAHARAAGRSTVERRTLPMSWMTCSVA